MAVDLLIVNAAEVLTLRDLGPGPARGSKQALLGIVRGGGVAIGGGHILDVGASDRVWREHRHSGCEVIDAKGGVVLPGFVDPHTHLVFAGDRADEWEKRMGGVSYLDILRQGGGILSTVKKTRAASAEVLLGSARRFAALAIGSGTTSVEIKSGYCLDGEGELKLLEVIARLGQVLPIEVVATYLGAHVLAPEYRADREGYLELVERTALIARQRGLARYFDVFCEHEAFTLEESRRLLTSARGLGFELKLHAEQFSASGAARLGLQLGATSIDHLEYLDDETLAELGRAANCPLAVLLPAVAFHLGLDRHAPGDRLVAAGVPVALATDMNPGSSFTPSMPMTIAIACRTQKLSVAQAIVAATYNAAWAVGLGERVGCLEPGRRADVLVCDVPDHRWLGYAFGYNPVSVVVADGRVVARGGHLLPAA